MTNEEAIKNLKKLKSFHNGSYGTAINLAIKALEQPPCEDCISREAVRELICQNNDYYGYSDRFHEFTEKCLQLPPVTPQRPKGEWILRNSFLVPYKCSECNYESERYDNYCPNCGAEILGDAVRDVTLLQKGKWIEYKVDVTPHPLHCSLCGFSNHHIGNRYMKEFRRCPNCGAEMEVEHE